MLASAGLWMKMDEGLIDVIDGDGSNGQGAECHENLTQDKNAPREVVL